MAEETNTIAFNRKALHDYFVVKTVEAGLALTGTEIKSIRAGRVNLREAYARPADGELWLYNMHVAQWPGAAYHNHDPLRARKLLLHRHQLLELRSSMQQKGLTLVPLRLYLKKHLAKVELALVKGKKLYDKREVIKKRDLEREMRQAMKRKA